MSVITDRIREQQGVEVTDEQAIAVLADLASSLERMSGTHELLVAGAITGHPLPYVAGFRKAVEMLQQAVVMHRQGACG